MCTALTTSTEQSSLAVDATEGDRSAAYSTASALSAAYWTAEHALGCMRAQPSHVVSTPQELQRRAELLRLRSAARDQLRAAAGLCDVPLPPQQAPPAAGDDIVRLHAAWPCPSPAVYRPRAIAMLPGEEGSPEIALAETSGVLTPPGTCVSPQRTDERASIARTLPGGGGQPPAGQLLSPEDGGAETNADVRDLREAFARVDESLRGVHAAWTSLAFTA
eukprot:TRINITY_DN51626_c0_g1_i1.p1 TRINITY_DN51626_c0_g1~~TRINITY_DN51626_c0_g1_i1.p1  ORF type:complete len:244 (+),score=53.41 TRINITY_DN51626_c0_g1_i1:75-734(+)